MQIVKEINDLINKSLNELGVDLCGAEIELEHPADMAHGDYASNIAMQVEKKDGESPRELAEKIVAKIPKHEYIQKAEVAGPGFINFYLSDLFFEKIIREILEKKEKWGEVEIHKGRTLLIEHSSPNLFKPFHIGHLVNNTYGEALVRIMRNSGAHVIALSFPSDISPGIAKAVWGILEAGLDSDFTVEQLGDAYVRGVRAYKEDANAKTRIDAINANLYKMKKGTPEWRVYARGRELSLSYFKTITKRLGSHFDGFIFESDAEAVGKAIVQENTPNVFEQSNGAIIFRGSKYGLFDNVYINSAGFGTYLAKDTGLLSIKFDTYDFDMSITITDVEQKQHFELVRKSAELINKNWSEKSLYLQHGRLSLTTGKISSRAGDVPLATDIIDVVKQGALKRMKENGVIFDEAVSEAIAIGAIKYAITRVNMGKSIVFDLHRSLSFEGDSGPYLQYTYARCMSILAKAGAQGAEAFLKDAGVGQSVMATNDVYKLLYRFPEIVERAVQAYAPHHIANYLNELASAFNTWYAKEKILDGSAVQVRKVALTRAVATTLKNGLHLLGIDAPERM